jgi:hypothetical protein
VFKGEQDLMDTLKMAQQECMNLQGAANQKIEDETEYSDDDDFDNSDRDFNWLPGLNTVKAVYCDGNQKVLKELQQGNTDKSFRGKKETKTKLKDQALKCQDSSKEIVIEKNSEDIKKQKDVNHSNSKSKVKKVKTEETYVNIVRDLNNTIN